MENKKESKSSKLGNFILIIGLILAISAIFLFIYNVPELWAQLLAVISSAFLGAGATSWMTNHLLERQSEAEEEREKNVKLHQSKLNAYTQFVSEMYAVLNKEEFKPEDAKRMREEIFKSLVFYVTPSTLKIIDEVLSKVKFEDGDQLALEFSKITKALRVELLDSDRVNKEQRDSINEEQLKNMWDALEPEQQFPSICTSDNETTLSDHVSQENEIIQEQPMDNISPSPISRYNQAWHFAMWDERQLKALDNGVHELSLTEWSQSWRTNLLKQVGANDIVFLFRRGGYGYIGAFEPKGWRVFEKVGGTINETIHMFGKDEEIVTEQEKVNADIKEYDIYGALDDGADLCSNLIVEEIVFNEKGVGYPGGVYRRTISRYDAGYAAQLMERFIINRDYSQNS